MLVFAFDFGHIGPYPRTGSMEGKWNVSKDNETPAHSLIESAMDRVASRASDKASADSRSGRGLEYDKAVSRRLGQLRTALGEDLPAPAPSALENHREPERPHRLSAPAVGHGRGYGPSAIVLTGGISALAGAGLMWLAIGGADRSNLPASVTPAALVPAAAAPVVTPPLPVNEGESQARDLVQRWRQAWASGDIEAYLGCYSAGFVPVSGQTRTNWAKARRAKLLTRSKISVQVHQMSIERIDNHQLKVVFLQDYASGRYRENARPKTLLLIRTGSDWRIAGEWHGTHLPSSVARK
jgi:ketosteroid isomerase-like protein